MTIPYAFVILSIIYINPYMPKGPLSVAYDLGAQNCRDYWWVNLLYMNDFIHQDKQVWTVITAAVDLVWKYMINVIQSVHGSHLVPFK